MINFSRVKAYVQRSEFQQRVWGEAGCDSRGLHTSLFMRLDLPQAFREMGKLLRVRHTSELFLAHTFPVYV